MNRANTIGLMTTIIRFILFFLLAPAFTIVVQAVGSVQNNFRIVDAGFQVVSVIPESVDAEICNYDSIGALLQQRRSLDGKSADEDDLCRYGEFATIRETQPFIELLAEFVAAKRVLPGTPGVVTGGSSTKLGKNMMESMGLSRSQTWKGYQAQHILPSEMASHPVIQKIGMNFDHASNGIFLRIPDDMTSTMSRHRGYHSIYNEVVERSLNRMDVNSSVNHLQQQVFDLQNKLRYLNQQGTPLYPSQGGTIELWERLLNNL